jgi:hypothetical protein
MKPPGAWALKFLLICYLQGYALAMYAKRQLPNDLQKVPESKRFKYNAADLFLSNEISADRAVSLFRDASTSDPKHSKKLGQSSGKNQARDLLRKLLKETKGWPPLYWAKIRMWDIDKQEIVMKLLPFYLPHELLYAIKQNSNLSLLQQVPVPHLQTAATELHVSLDDLIAVGLWGDGTPCNWDRSESLESFTMSLPGVHSTHENLRLPITVINKKYCAQVHSYDDIMAVISWSLTHAALGRNPRCRHDGTEFQKSLGDSVRVASAAKPLGFQAVLCQVTGDWAFFKQVFRFPSWNERDNCCYRCSANSSEIRDPSPEAAWRIPSAVIVFVFCQQMFCCSGKPMMLCRPIQVIALGSDISFASKRKRNKPTICYTLSYLFMFQNRLATHHGLGGGPRLFGQSV